MTHPDQEAPPENSSFCSIGKPITRKEDARLVTGHGLFSDDFSLEGQACAVMLRSPHPHARILGIDAAQAKAMPGVFGVFTGVDCHADGLAAIPHDPLPKTKYDMKLHAAGGGAVFIGPQMLLPTARVRHVGEALAMVVAESVPQGLDAVECIKVDYEVSPGVYHSEDALRPGAPTLWSEAPDNVLVDTLFGDRQATDEAFARADHVLAMDFHIERVTGVPLEPRAALGEYETASGRYTLHAGSGGAVRQKREIAAVLGIAPERLRVLSYDVGGNCVSLSPLSKGAGLIVGPYLIPHAALRAMAVFTNTMPTNAYRSSGRPEVTFAIERLVDTAAEQLGIDRIELRRKNLVRPEAMPYRNAVGMTYDSGRYEENMDRAMEIADWSGFERRRRAAAKRGKLLGRGLANYVESSIGAPNEQARVAVRSEGRVDVVIGTQPSGQGHETSFAQVISDLLRVPVESVKIIVGDTDVVQVGGGSHSGRSLRHAATLFTKALPELIAQGKKVAATIVRSTPDQIEFADGRFSARGTNRTFDFLELAEEAARHELPQ